MALYNTRALLMTAVTILLLCTGCTGRKLHVDYTDDYLKALTDIPGVPARDRAALENFLLAMSDLKDAAAKTRLEKAYAPQLYFNDTVRTLRTREEVVDYMLRTAERVESLTVEVNDVAARNNDYYLRWVMRMRFKMSGDIVESKSIGMSHIRTDAEGRVVIHQDYWDGIEGLYQYIPFVGYMVGKVQSGM
ncbi:MAG TPA: nuclear transport factor 2 family protein [Gammaproteobacteria bacterium]|nr:nuclear transport factor 2 family protein [Gammaproteobacteria bacterium]